MSQPRVIVFYAGVVIYDIEGRIWNVPSDVPEGAWAYITGSGSIIPDGWQHKQYGWNVTVTADVPKDIRLMAHLLSQ